MEKQKMKMKIKKGDTVNVIAGKDKGRKGKVLRALEGKFVVEGVGEVKKRRKPRKAGEKGQVVTISMPIDASNVMLYCGNCKKGVRIGTKYEGDKKVRVCVKCKGII